MSGTRNEKSDVSRGLGIGLTLVHHIIEKVNGTIIPENNEPGDYIKATKVNILLQ
jgi:K+-sensing histidine kinase KdpD